MIAKGAEAVTPIDVHPGSRFLAALLGAESLKVLFQPIVSFREQIEMDSLFAVVGGPDATSIDTPGSLQRMVRDLGLEVGIDRLTTTTALRRVGSSGSQVPVFLRIDHQTLANDPGFDDLLGRACERYGVPLTSVTLAIRYRPHLEPSEAALVSLGRLRRLGVSIALDRFGSEPMDEVMIERFEPHSVMIDDYWVTGASNDEIRTAVLASLVDRVRRRGADVIASGVNSPSDLDVVRQAGVQFARGLLLGAPGSRWLFSRWREAEVDDPAETPGLTRPH